MNIIQAVLGRTLQKRGADWLDDRFFPSIMELRPTKTGKLLSLEQLLQNPTVFACCRIRTESVAVLSRQIYRPRSDGGWEPVKRTDPRQKLLGRFPNSQMSRFEFEQTMGFQDLIYGNAFAYIERDDKFKPVAMWPLQSRNMKVARDKNTGLMVFKYRKPGGEERTFMDWEIHHRRGPSLDGILGLSVFELAMNSFALGLALEEYCCRIFENDASPRGFLTHKAKLDTAAKERIREEWQKKHGGLANAGNVGILDMELDFKTVGQTNDVMQFVETYGHQREIVCSWFRIPQHMAGVLTRSTNNNIQQQSLEFMRDTLAPDLERIEERLDHDILTDDEKDLGYRTKHRIEDLLRGDIPEQTQQLVLQIQNGIRSVNEARKEKDLNPIEGGDEYLKPLNMGVIGQPDPVQNPPGSGENPQQNEPDPAANEQKTEKKPAKTNKKRAEVTDFAPILEDACKRIVGREFVAMERECKRAKNFKELHDFAEKFYPEFKENGEKALRPIFDSMQAATGLLLRSESTRLINDSLDEYIDAAKLDLVGFGDSDSPQIVLRGQRYTTAVNTPADQLRNIIFNKLEEVRNG